MFVGRDLFNNTTSTMFIVMSSMPKPLWEFPRVTWVKVGQLHVASNL